MPGVRRIWGTLKSASITAVSSTLNKLTTLGSQLTVKKKVKPGGKHWWFLIKGTEEVLKNLEEEWVRVSLQIDWKLEPCTRPKIDSDVPNLSPAADATHTVTSNARRTLPAQPTHLIGIPPSGGYRILPREVPLYDRARKIYKPHPLSLTTPIFGPF